MSGRKDIWTAKSVPPAGNLIRRTHPANGANNNTMASTIIIPLIGKIGATNRSSIDAENNIVTSRKCHHHISD